MQPARQRDAVLRLKRAILEDYSYRDLRGVDWRRQFAKFGPRLSSSHTLREFAREAVRLLGVAKDLHLWLQLGCRKVPTYRRCLRKNVNLLLLPKVVPGWRQHNQVVVSGKFADGIVYLCLRAWPANRSR